MLYYVHCISFFLWIIQLYLEVIYYFCFLGYGHSQLQHVLIRQIGQHYAVSTADRSNGGLPRTLQRSGPEYRWCRPVAGHLLLCLLSDQDVPQQPAVGVSAYIVQVLFG